MPLDRQVPMGYQQITNLSSAVALTVPAEAQTAVIVCEGQAVRWRADGTSPTAAIGMPLAVGQALIFDGEFGGLKFMEQAASAKLNVSYYREA